MKTLAAILIVSGQIAFAQSPDSSAAFPTRKSPVDQLIPWLLNENQQLRGLPFSEVIFDTTGKRVLAVDRKNEVDQRVIKQISAALDKVMKKLNSPASPIQNIECINEVSSYFENSLCESLNTIPAVSCDFPRTADGKIQRSGYPDLRLVDLTSKRVFYLDPKLYAAGSRDSSFRAFYFEPKIATNKVREDAVHLVAGFEHEPHKDGHWNFTRWDLVDLSQLKGEVESRIPRQPSRHVPAGGGCGDERQIIQF